MIELEDNEQGDLRIVMQDPQEIPAEQQAANQQETKNTQAANAEQVVNSEEQPTPAHVQPAPQGRIAELEAQLAQARREAADNWSKYLRERADVDNIRKRQERLVLDRVQLQKKALFKQILEVMDNVERALIYQETMDKQELQQILRMLQWQMGEVLRAEGLSPVPTIGEVFNPYIHEAVEAVENSDKPEGTILEELRKGYTLGEETLRPARVKVSVGNN
jgi:molecular chaperone GrpE